MNQVIAVITCAIATLIGVMGFASHDQVWLLTGIGLLLLVIASK